MKRALSLAWILLLTACMNAPSHVSVSTDNFNPNIDLSGPIQSAISTTTVYRWQLYSVVDKKTHEVTHALYFDIDFQGVKDPLISAYDNQAHALILLRLHPDKGPCNPAVHSECEYTERAEVLLNESYLNKRMESGFKIKISSRNGTSYVLPITAQMIKLQLDAAEKYTH